MNEHVNSPAKWLQYLLYVSLAAALNYLGVYSLLGGLASWVLLAISAANIYILFRLRDANPRYQNAAIFSAVCQVCILIGGTVPVLVGSVCGIIGQYHEYYGHSELVEGRDSRLAGNWKRLFWAQFVVGLLLGLAVSIIGVVMAMISGTEVDAITSLTGVLSNLLSLALRVLYLVYLYRTVKLLENEFVM